LGSSIDTELDGFLINNLANGKPKSGFQTLDH
jgi:hypothetical protein